MQMKKDIMLKGSKILCVNIGDVIFRRLHISEFSVLGKKYYTINLPSVQVRFKEPPKRLENSIVGNISVSNNVCAPLNFYGFDAIDVVNSLFSCGYYDKEEASKILEILDAEMEHIMEAIHSFMKNSFVPEKPITLSKTLTMFEIKFSNDNDDRKIFNNFKLNNKIPQWLEQLPMIFK